MPSERELPLIPLQEEDDLYSTASDNGSSSPSDDDTASSLNRQEATKIPILMSVVASPSSRRQRPRSNNITQRPQSSSTHAPLGLLGRGSSDILSSLLGGGGSRQQQPYSDDERTATRYSLLDSSRQTSTRDSKKRSGSPTSATMLAEYNRGSSMTIDRPSLDPSSDTYVYIPKTSSSPTTAADGGANSSVGAATGIHSFFDESLLRQSRRANTSLPRRICRTLVLGLKLFLLLLLPIYIGAVMVLFALDRRAKKVPLFLNERDWVVVVSIGALLQLSFLSVMVHSVPEVRDTLVDRLKMDQDYLGPFFVYPVTSLYMCIIAVVFLFHDWRQAKKEKREVGKRQRMQIQAIVQRLSDAVKFRPEFIVVISLVVSALAVMATRFCGITRNCPDGNNGNQLWEAHFMSEPLMYLLVFFEFAQFYIVTAVLVSSCSLYWQNLQLVRVFVSPQKLDDYRHRSGSLLGPAARRRKKKKQNKATVKNWNDFSRPESLAVWYELYQVIVAGMNQHPAVVAVCAPTFLLTFFISVAGSVTVVVDNVYQRHGIASFTTILIALIILSLVTVCTFLYLTVQLDYTVTLQSQRICDVQNQLQGQIELLRSGQAPVEMASSVSTYTLEAKVHALKALDVFMRHCDANPKLIGLSLASIRWTIIMLLLAFVNAFFVLLFMIYCEDTYNARFMKHSMTRTPTLPF